MPVTQAVLLMPLMNEGTDVWRPVDVKPLDDETYQILGPMPEAEQWAFAPGSIVASAARRFNGEERAVAVSLG